MTPAPDGQGLRVALVIAAQGWRGTGASFAKLARGLADGAVAQRVGAAARRRIEREFPLERMLDGYERAFAEIVGTRRAGG